MTTILTLPDASAVARGAANVYDDPEAAWWAADYYLDLLKASIDRVTKEGADERTEIRKALDMVAFKANLNASSSEGTKEVNLTRSAVLRIAAYAIVCDRSWQEPENHALLWVMVRPDAPATIVGYIDAPEGHSVVTVPVTPELASKPDVKVWPTREEAHAQAKSLTEEAEQDGWFISVPPQNVLVEGIPTSHHSTSPWAGFGALLIGALSDQWPDPPWWQRAGTSMRGTPMHRRREMPGASRPR